MQFRHCGSTEARGSAALKVGSDVAVVSRSIVSRSAGRVTRSSALPRAHCCISGSSSRALLLLEVKILELHVQFFKHFAQLHHLSTRHWLMRQLSAVHAKSKAFGATTQDLHSEPLCETSTVETVATWPDSVAQNAFTTNKTHISDITRCSARQCKACPSENLWVHFAGLPLGLLDACDQHLGEILFRVPTMVTHVGQKQFVHNWTAQASNANQVLLPTREGSIHLLFRNNKSVSEILRLNDACPSDAGVNGPIGIAVVVPILVIFRRGLLSLCGFISFIPLFLPLFLHFTQARTARARTVKHESHHMRCTQLPLFSSVLCAFCSLLASFFAPLGTCLHR